MSIILPRNNVIVFGASLPIFQQFVVANTSRHARCLFVFKHPRHTAKTLALYRLLFFSSLSAELDPSLSVVEVQKGQRKCKGSHHCNGWLEMKKIWLLATLRASQKDQPSKRKLRYLWPCSIRSLLEMLLALYSNHSSEADSICTIPASPPTTIAPTFA
jgi:hypothetical protein